MSTPAEKLSFYRNRIPLFLGLLALPWLWATLIVPWWVSVVGLLMVPIFTVVTVIVVFPSPSAPRRADDGPQLSNSHIDKMREASTGLYNMLGRWSTVSRDTRASLEKVQAQVDDVMAQTEKSVIDVTNSFMAITRKTRTQMELALGLLQQARTAEDAGEEENLSLPEYIRASEAMLNSLGGHLMHFSDASLGLVQRQEQVREQARRIDNLLDQMTTLGSQMSRVALSTSVMVQGSDRRDFVDLADKMRNLSQAANDLSRDVRQSLSEIKQTLAQSHGALNGMAQEARTTAQQALKDVKALSEPMLNRNSQVVEILDRINAVGQEIQQDINQIIVGMQFQDITQQKLARLKHPVLSRMLESLQSLSEETRFLNQRLNTKLVDTSKILSEAPFRVVKRGETTIADGAAQASEPKPQGEGGGKNVELF